MFLRTALCITDSSSTPCPYCSSVSSLDRHSGLSVMISRIVFSASSRSPKADETSPTPNQWTPQDRRYHLRSASGARSIVDKIHRHGLKSEDFGSQTVQTLKLATNLVDRVECCQNSCRIKRRLSLSRLSRFTSP